MYLTFPTPLAIVLGQGHLVLGGVVMRARAALGWAA